MCHRRQKKFLAVGQLSTSLPEGFYSFADVANETQAAIAWGLGAYQFSRYKKSTRTPARLVLSKKCDVKTLPIRWNLFIWCVI